MKFCFCQISNNLINPPNGSTAEKFYEIFWQEKHKDGYYKPEHFWELPLWVAEICYTLPDDVEREFMVVEEQDINLVPDRIYCFSVLDVNVNIIKYIIENNQQCRFVLGGYNDSLKGAYVNSQWCNSVREFCELYGCGYRYGTDFSLFAGTECVPRLTLSTGCRHRCKFCIIENEVVEKTQQEIYKQLCSFRLLKFKLIYVNDKTFGQAKNHKLLDNIYRIIKHDNPEFEGFIVQTTATMVASKAADLKDNFWKEHHIKVVEIGVETFNDKLLKRYHKPANEYRIRQALEKLYVCGIKIIPNIILGLPGETVKTYRNTHDWLWIWRKDFYSLNIYTLAAYADAELDIVASDGDTDELNDDRSFWTPEERAAYKAWSDEFYKLGINIILED